MVTIGPPRRGSPAAHRMSASASGDVTGSRTTPRPTVTRKKRLQRAAARNQLARVRSSGGGNHRPRRPREPWFEFRGSSCRRSGGVDYELYGLPRARRLSRMSPSQCRRAGRRLSPRRISVPPSRICVRARSLLQRLSQRWIVLHVLSRAFRSRGDERVASRVSRRPAVLPCGTRPGGASESRVVR